MRSFQIIAVAAFSFSAQLAFANGLGGNLDYTLNSVYEVAKLTLTNKRTDTAATLTSVAILLPAENGKESKQISLPAAQGRPISPTAIIDLGTVSALAKQIAPGRDVSQFKSVTVSENDSCKNCDLVPFLLKIAVEYQGGAKQETQTIAYLHYFVR